MLHIASIPHTGRARDPSHVREPMTHDTVTYAPHASVSSDCSISARLRAVVRAFLCTMGLLGLEYLSVPDDPRNNNS